MKSRLVSVLRSFSSKLNKLADRWDGPKVEIIPPQENDDVRAELWRGYLAKINRDRVVDGAIVVAAGSLLVVAAIKAPIATVAVIGLYCVANGIERKYRKSWKKPVASVGQTFKARSVGAAAASDSIFWPWWAKITAPKPRSVGAASATDPNVNPPALWVTYVSIAVLGVVAYLVSHWYGVQLYCAFWLAFWAVGRVIPLVAQMLDKTMKAMEKKVMQYA